MADLSDTPTVEFIPSGAGVGLEVRGLNLSDEQPPQIIDTLKKKLADHGVLLFRAQELTEQQQLEFTRAFGETAGHPVPGVGGANPTEDADPEVFYLTNAVEGYDDEEKNEKSKKNIGDGALGWHTDLQYMPEPQVYSFLYGVEVPDEGGETEFCNMSAAYAALDAPMKEKIASLRAIHWFVRKIPPSTHPVVRKHPITGRKALYVSPGLSRLIEGMDKDEGKALIKTLCDHATQKRFCWSHHWRVGDVLVWDNRCTMHRRHGFDVSERRIVRRTQTAGEPVIA